MKWNKLAGRRRRVSCRVCGLHDTTELHEGRGLHGYVSCDRRGCALCPWMSPQKDAKGRC